MKVLIAVEESECSRQAVESVLERQWPDDSEIRVISVCEPMMTNYGPELYSPHVIDAMVQAEQEILSRKRKLVEEDVEKIKNAHIARSVTGEVLSGSARRSIIDESKEWKADLIVLGSHCRKGLSKFFLGSVAEGVAGTADCSVEIVKSKHKR